jgi:outer membrane lipoprotein-sorting protein
MEHKYNERDLEQAIRRTAPGEPPRPDFADWQEKHPDVLLAGNRSVGARAEHDRPFASVIRFGRNVMRRNKVRFGAIAAALVLALVFLGTGTDKAWSVEQTLAAMKKIETVHITGKNLCGGKMVDFECWVRTPADDSDILRMRYQCGCERKTTLVVQGDTVYEYRATENVVNILDGSKIEDLQYWYEGAMISPWLTGKLLETLRLVGRGWEQTTVTDPNTGQEQIQVTCSHPKSNVSALLVVDPETKLVLKAKLWKNLRREGQPQFDAQGIAYNPEIPDEFFEFKVPAGATVVSRTLFDQAENLFQKKMYAEAMELYRQVYDTYPTLNIGEEALMMIGICHAGLGQHEKAIEVFQETIREFPDLKGWIDATWFYLGGEYLRTGQREKALDAFENCLAAGEGIRDPEKFPLKDAREFIAKLKGE